MRESLALGAIFDSMFEINPAENEMRTFSEQDSPPSHAYCAWIELIFRALAIAHLVYLQLRPPSRNQHRHGE